MAAKVGLTGGIGSGKSTVGALFRSQGVEVIDADEIAREVTAPGTTSLEEIVAHFGNRVLTGEKTLNRQELGRLVFSDSSERQWLENLLHPLIRAKMDGQAKLCKARWCVLEIPLLVESGRYREMDRNIVVRCEEETRIRRVMSARGMERARVEKIIGSQASDEQRDAIADYVIENNGSVELLSRQVRQVSEALSKEFER